MRGPFTAFGIALHGWAVLIVLALSGSAAAATVTGTVRDAGTGSALASKVVAAYTPQAGTLQASATSDSAGHYNLTVTSGNYRILAYDPNQTYATTFGGNAPSFEESPVVGVTTTVSGLDFSLQRAGTVSGTISGAAGPLSGITVAAYNPSGTRRGFVQTSAGGGYSLLLPPGQFRIAAYDDPGSFSPRFYPDQYGFPAATPVGVASGVASTGINVHLELATHLGGTVGDFDTSAALSGMFVYAYTSTATVASQATSDSSGSFTMSAPPGTYKVVAADPRGIYATGFLGDAHSFGQSPDVSLSPGGSRLNLQMTLHRGGTVTGRVLGDGNAPLANMVVAAYYADGTQRVNALSDTFGGYTLVLPQGSFRLAAYDQGKSYATQFFSSENTLEAATDITIIPAARTDSVDFTLVRGARISGLIREAGTGVPLAGIGVGAYDSSGEKMSDSVSDTTGAYVMVTPPGTYKFAAFDTALRYATAYSGGAANYDAAAAYTVASNAFLSVDFTLTQGLRVGGTVRDAANAPLSGIEVGALDLDGNRVATAIAEDGVFALALKSGSYKFVASDPEGHYRKAYYGGATTFSDGTTLTVQSGPSLPSIDFVLAPLAPRHRSVSH